MASFSGEYLKRPVVDNKGELFGHLEDVVIDTRSGEITEILVDVVTELDASKLPWPISGGLCRVPAQEIAQMGAKISLVR